MANIIVDAIGAVAKKVTQWIPSRRESLNNTIDKIKEEMVNVQNKRPFNATRYERLVEQLRKAETLERRAE